MVPAKKTTALKIKRIPDSSNIFTIAEATKQFANQLKGIRIVKRKVDGTKNAILDFISSKFCTDAQEETVTIEGKPYHMMFTSSRKNDDTQHIASENKLYVKYPSTASESEIVKMLGDVHISKPENAMNFFFAQCDDMEQQHKLIRDFDKAKVTGGELVVKVAVDKIKKERFARSN
ncbi:hypothetical protein ENBRE01_0385 [Enteropsectra breve]|nr:hypothetical protein ENBRE01_0385 [Enteropsectra breve]